MTTASFLLLSSYLVSILRSISSFSLYFHQKCHHFLLFMSVKCWSLIHLGEEKKMTRVGELKFKADVMRKTCLELSQGKEKEKRLKITSEVPKFLSTIESHIKRVSEEGSFFLSCMSCVWEWMSEGRQIQLNVNPCFPQKCSLTVDWNMREWWWGGKWEWENEKLREKVEGETESRES